MMENFDIVIIGGGASGLIAAGRAAEMGAKVLLLEHKSKPGRKLAITGKGRCNLTNSSELPEFLNHFHPNGRFLRNSFSRFFSGELVSLLNRLGIETVEERGGRIFPKNGKAPEVVEALMKWLREQNVTILKSTTVSDFLIEDNSISGVKACPVKQHKQKIIPDQKKLTAYNAKRVILATGGASYPATGSTGDGYRLAKSIGHKVITPRPALVPLEVNKGQVLGLEGLDLRNIEISMWVNGKKMADAFGEMSFTEFGLSGPVILTISHQVVDALLEKARVSIKLDLKPALDHKKLDRRLLRDLENNRQKSIQKILKGLLPKQLIAYCSQQLGISLEKKASDMSAKERKSLRLWLKDIPFDITGYRPFNEAIVTAGGVSLQEINPKTLESRLIDNLHFAGEVMDIQADTGGFNLQAAFSTGYLAAESAVGGLSGNG